LVSDGVCFSFERSVVLTCLFAVFLSEAHPGATDGPPQGFGGPRIGFFFQKLLMSGIIYGILDSRFIIVVDKLIHLTNDQLGKLVSP
jgi:hypothetical protein